MTNREVIRVALSEYILTEHGQPLNEDAFGMISQIRFNKMESEMLRQINLSDNQESLWGRNVIEIPIKKLRDRILHELIAERPNLIGRWPEQEMDFED
jgi:hypothetical protein